MSTSPSQESDRVSKHHAAKVCRELVAHASMNGRHLSDADTTARRQVLNRAFELAGLCVAHDGHALRDCPALLKFQNDNEELRTKALQSLGEALASRSGDALVSAMLLVGAIVLQFALESRTDHDFVDHAHGLLRELDHPRRAGLMDLLDQACAESVPFGY